MSGSTWTSSLLPMSISDLTRFLSALHRFYLFACLPSRVLPFVKETIMNLLHLFILLSVNDNKSSTLIIILSYLFANFYYNKLNFQHVISKTLEFLSSIVTRTY